MSKKSLAIGSFLLGTGLAITSLAGLRAAGAGIGSRAAGVQARPAADKPLQHEVSVVLKLVHVYVTDKKGLPVPDLLAGDFVVTDNGRPMTVTDFEKRTVQSRPEAGPAVAAPRAEPTEPGPKTAPVARSASRKFFLFFDFAFNNARGLVKARRAALHFLDTELRPGDEVGILTFSVLNGFKVHEYLTKDRAKVREVVERIGSKDTAGRASEVESWYWRLAEAPHNVKEGQADSGADPYLTPPHYAYEAKSQREEAKRLGENYLIRLTALARAMVYVEGQKHILLFSSGLPNSLVYGAQAGNPGQTSRAGSWATGEFDIGDAVLKDRAEAMIKAFADSGCTFFSFDTRESAKSTDLFGWDAQGLETGGRSVLSTQSVFSESTNQFRDDRITGRDFLKQMSDQTGGEYYSNIDRYEKGFDQVQAVTGTFYVLGYPINEKWDGQYHQVKVEVKRRGCEVRAQAGYFNPKPFGEYSDLEKQLHLFDLALNERALSRLPDRVAMGAFAVSAEGITRLAVLARLPEGVTAKFTGKRLEFVAIFFDAKGEIADMAREEIDPAPHRGRDLAFAAGSALKPGQYMCRLVVRDMDSGMSAVASVKASVGKPLVTGLELGTPLILEARTGCSLRTARPGKSRAAFPWADLYPYDSALFAPALVELPAGPASFKAVIPCAVPAGPPADLVLTASLINAADGARSPITITRVDRLPRGPVEVLDLEFRAPSVPAGTYFLHFYVQDRAAGSLGHAFTTLAVPKR